MLLRLKGRPRSAFRRFGRCRHMTDTVALSGNRILSFIERIERIDEELKELSEGKKEVFNEAKGEGFDVKILKEILRLRKQDQDERDEQGVFARPLSANNPKRGARGSQSRIKQRAMVPTAGTSEGSVPAHSA